MRLWRSRWLWLAAFCSVLPAQTTVAGGDWVGDGQSATRALLAQPEGLARDSAGNLYIADSAAHRVRRIRPNGVIETVAGTGQPGFAGDDGPARSAQLRNPYDVAVDAQGNVLIADYGNARIRRVAANGVITTLAGGGAQSPFSAAAVLATEIRLRGPRNLTLDVLGNVFFSDFDGHYIARISLSGSYTRIAGTGTGGNSGDGGPAAAAQLNSPAGLVLDTAGSLYFADTGNRAVRRILGGSISTVVGSLTGAIDVAVDRNGTTLLVARAPLTATVNGNVTGALGPVFATRSVLVEPDGNVLLSTGRQVRRMERPSGSVANIAGTGAWEFAGDGGPATAARLNQPHGLAVDSRGNLYIADEGNHRVRRVTPEGTVSTFAGNGEAATKGDGGLATAASLHRPAGLLFDSTGHLLVVERGGNVIRRVSPAGIISTLAGTGEAGEAGDGGPARQASFRNPTGLCAEPGGGILVVDTGNHVVRRITSDGRIALAFGAYDGGERLRGPEACSAAADGTIAIADTGRSRVLLVTRDGTQTELALAGVAALLNPRAVAFTAQNGLAVADDRGRVLLVNSTDGAAVALLARAAETAQPRGLLVVGNGLLVSDTARNTVERLALPVPDAVVPPPAISTLTVLHAATFRESPLAPGGIVSLWGENIGPATPVAGVVERGTLATAAGLFRVTIGGRPAPVFYASATQWNVQVPYEVAGQTTAEVAVWQGDVKVSSATIPVTAAAPGLLMAGSSVTLPAALHLDGALVSPLRPAARGSIVTLYATGEGLTTSPLTGRLAAEPYARPLLPVRVLLGDEEAEVLWAGSAPGLAGVLQVNVRIPGGFGSSGELPLALRVGAFTSQPGVVLPVR